MEQAALCAFLELDFPKSSSAKVGAYFQSPLTCMVLHSTTHHPQDISGARTSLPHIQSSRLLTPRTTAGCQCGLPRPAGPGSRQPAAQNLRGAKATCCCLSEQVRALWAPHTCERMDSFAVYFQTSSCRAEDLVWRWVECLRLGFVVLQAESFSGGSSTLKDRPPQGPPICCPDRSESQLRFRQEALLSLCTTSFVVQLPTYLQNFPGGSPLLCS